MKLIKIDIIIFVIIQFMQIVQCQKNFTLKENSSHLELFKTQSILYGLTLIAVKNESEINCQCISELKETHQALVEKQPWAMKIYDSSGNPSSGFILGNNFWLGSHRECDHVNKPLKLPLSNRYSRKMKKNILTSVSPFEVQFRVVHAQHNSPWQVEVKFMRENIIHIGLCLPKSCSNEEIFKLTENYLDDSSINIQKIFQINAEVIQVKDLNLSQDFYHKKTLWILCAIVGVTVFLTFLSHVTEIQDEILSIDVNNNNTNNNKGIPQKTFSGKLLDAFSVRRNWNTFTDESVSPDSFPIICGLKAISCFLVLAFHILWFSYDTIENRALMFQYGDQLKFQMFANAPFVVDLFFAISGFLMAYDFLRNKVRIGEIQNNSFRNNSKLLGKLLLHRYVRISPPYLLVCLIAEIETSYLIETSKYWITNRHDQLCHRYWWRNLFYIENLFDFKDLCICWSWSLACDMQYYIIFTLILFIYAKNNKAGVNCFIGLSALIVTISTWSIFKYKFIPTWDVVYNTTTQLYIAPWVRILPYLIGVGCGYYLYNYRNTFNVSERNSKFLWIVSSIFLSAIIHCTIYRDIPTWVIYCILMLGRLFGSLAVFWFIMGTICGEANFISNFLSARIFVLINKLTYAIYLLNPLLILFVFHQSANGTNVEPVTMAVSTIGISVLTTVVALGFTLLFEIPYCNLSKEFLNGKIVFSKKVT